MESLTPLLFQGLLNALLLVLTILGALLIIAVSRPHDPDDDDDDNGPASA